MTPTHQVPKTICVLLGLIGLVAYIAVAWIDIKYGEATAFSADGKQLQPIIMAIVSAAGFVFISSSGAFARSKNWFAASLALAASIGCMAYSGLNGVGFFAGETISLTRAVEAKSRAQKDAVDLANTEMIAQRRRAMDWMTGTQIKTSKERERIEQNVIDLATRPVDVKAVEPSTVVADARSEVMRKLFGIEVENAQITNSTWLVAILLACKLLGPSLAFALWPAARVGQSLQENSPAFPSGNAQNWTLSPKELSKQEALLDLRRMFPTRTHQLTLPFLAAKWGLTAEGTRQRLKDWEARKLITLDKTKTDRGYALYVKAISPVLVANNADMKESA